jgi:hypothetical protein
MLKDVFQFPCPCCGKMVEVDTRSGHARAVRPDEAKGGQNLDKLLKSHKGESQRLADVFDDAARAQKKQGERLDDVLKRAKDEAKKDKDDKPRNIFDLE